MRCDLIAEIGANWKGDLALAEDMICAAAESGADYAKTQTWCVDKLRKGPWEDHMDVYRNSQLNTTKKHLWFKDICERYSISYLTTVFDADDVNIVKDIGITSVKIAGIEADNFELLDRCSDTFDFIFISTCGLSFESIKKTSDYLKSKDVDFNLMHGIYMYPCPLQYSNVQEISDLFELHDKVGYSDHTEGPYASYYAISLGAQVVERHFTTDNSLGIDNTFSCLPEEMRQVADFRDAFLTMSKKSTPDESFILDNFKGRWSGN